MVMSETLALRTDEVFIGCEGGFVEAGRIIAVVVEQHELAKVVQNASRVGLTELGTGGMTDDVVYRVVLQDALREVRNRHAVPNEVEENRHGRRVERRLQLQQAHAHDYAYDGRRSEYEDRAVCTLDSSTLTVVGRIGNPEHPRRHARVILDHGADAFEVRTIRLIRELDRFQQRLGKGRTTKIQVVERRPGRDRT